MNLTELQAALDRCIANGYTVFVSHYSHKVHVTLSRHGYGAHAMSVEVKGEGDTVAEAFESTFRNFPTNPLDGVSHWASNQLGVSDGEFTETTQQ